MEDSKPLSEYGIQHLSVIDVMVFQSRGGDVDMCDEVDKHGKGDKKVDKKYSSIGYLADFRGDCVSPKKEKENCVIL